MVQGDFQAPVRAKPVGLSGGQFRFVVEALDDARGNLAARPKPVHEQRAMPAQHAGNLLHRFEARAHDLDAPLVQECAGPVDRAVVPEVVKPFPQQHGADGPQVVLHELAQADTLVARLVLSTFQQQPPRLREERLAPPLPERVDFGAADRVDRVAQVLGDMEPIEDVKRVAGLLGDDLIPAISTARVLSFMTKKTT